jgi:hypothetical protein
MKTEENETQDRAATVATDGAAPRDAVAETPALTAAIAPQNSAADFTDTRDAVSATPEKAPRAPRAPRQSAAAKNEAALAEKKASAANAPAETPVVHEAQTSAVIEASAPIVTRDFSETNVDNSTNSEAGTHFESAPNSAGSGAGSTEAAPQETTVNDEAPRAVRLPEMRGEGREERAALPVRGESRGLRFRGRDGRAEVRGRTEPRGFRNRPDGRTDGRNNNGRGENPNGHAASGRLQPQGQRDSNRDNGQRDNSNRDNVPRDNAQRDHNQRDNTPRDYVQRDDNRVLERDVARSANDFDLPTLEEKNLTDLREIAKTLNIPATAGLKKTDWCFAFWKRKRKLRATCSSRASWKYCPMAKVSCAPKAICRAMKTFTFRSRRSSVSI